MNAELAAVPPLFGFETEYGFGAQDHKGQPIKLSKAYDGIEAYARRTALHLPGEWRSGIFLANGSNFYRDSANGGAHLELATAEVTNPTDAVLMIEAGHRHLGNFLRGWKSEAGPVGEANFFRHSFDHLTGKSWATHMSLMTSSPPEQMLAGLLPHLVSKLIFGGSGGFLPDKNHDLEFCLAPRLYGFKHASGSDTQEDRALIDYRGGDHSLAQFTRLHLIGFESLCSHLARYLDAGATALIVRMIDAGVRIPEGLQPADPLDALRTFASDPTCRKQVAGHRGRKLTAVQIQRGYLEVVLSHLDKPWMPPWAGSFCPLWRDTIERIELGAPDSVSDRLDWALKYTLFKAHADRHAAGSWTACRLELLELDMRYGQFGGEPSVFGQLDAAGMLSHRLPATDDASIDRAMHNPPQDTRAKPRSEAIRQLWQSNHIGVASWAWVRNVSNQTRMNIADPFAVSDDWDREPAPDDLPDSMAIRPSEFGGMDAMLDRVLELYDKGRFFDAAHVVGSISRGSLNNRERLRCLSIGAWVAARLGLEDESRSLLQQFDLACEPYSLRQVIDELVVLRFLQLVPQHHAEHWIAQGKIILVTREPGTSEETESYHLAAGAVLCRLGHPSKGLVRLGAVVNAPCFSNMNARLRARAFADSAEALRMLGDTGLAARRLAEAEVIQRQNGYPAELADFTLPVRAKLEPDPSMARACLAEATDIQERCATPVTLARSLLLDARLEGSSGGRIQHTKLVQLAEAFPRLSRDKTLRRILGHWDHWIGGGSDPDGISADAFWGL